MSTGIEGKLGLNKYRVDEGNPHIIVRDRPENQRDMDKLIKGCPAGLYRQNDDGTVRFDYAGCLECGACRVLANGTVIAAWNHPQGTMGVELRFG